MPISYPKFRTESARNRARKKRDKHKRAPHKKNWLHPWQIHDKSAA